MAELCSTELVSPVTLFNSITVFFHVGEWVALDSDMFQADGKKQDGLERCGKWVFNSDRSQGI